MNFLLFFVEPLINRNRTMRSALIRVHEYEMRKQNIWREELKSYFNK